MATLYTHVCDRCKKTVESMSLGPVKIQKRLCARVSFRSYSDEVWDRYPQEYALCSSCRDELERFMKGDVSDEAHQTD